jgi:hypothetical protein
MRLLLLEICIGKTIFSGQGSQSMYFPTEVKVHVSVSVIATSPHCSVLPVTGIH